MQTLDVISINLWQMLVSLINLLLLFLIVKHFLYKPVKRILSQREKSIDDRYKQAEKAKAQALADKQRYEEQLSAAKQEADGIIQSAVSTADFRQKEMVEAARAEAQTILKAAREDAALELKKAQSTIKGEIVDVSTKLTEKILGREITAQDHASLVDSFIDELGDGDE